MPLRRLATGLREQRVDPLGAQVGVGRSEVVEEGRAVRHQPGWEESQATTSAAFRSGGKTG